VLLKHLGLVMLTLNRFYESQILIVLLTFRSQFCIGSYYMLNIRLVDRFKYSHIFYHKFSNEKICKEGKWRVYLYQKSVTNMLISVRSSLFHVWRFSLGDSFLGDIRRCLLFLYIAHTFSVVVYLDSKSITCQKALILRIF
jgi:hypothetical protein